MRECMLASNKTELSLTSVTGEAYEYATFLSIDQGDIEGFERNFSMLRFYYDEFS